MTRDSDPDTRRQQAADWFSRLGAPQVSSDDIRHFFEWRRDPDNARAYERIEALWSSSRRLADDPEIAALTAKTLGHAAPPTRARAVVSGLWKPLAGLACVLVVAGIAGVWALNRPLTYSTTVGELRTVQLEDGSRVVLDTDSRIRVRLGRDHRTILLDSGQALFVVATDKARPFTVQAGDTRVTALGTRFDVRRLEGGARVTLVEGQVAVTAVHDGRGEDWRLAPGQQVVTAAARPAVASVDANRATSWTTGRLIFEGTPIREAVAEVNRYSTRRIELRASAIANIPVSGAFDTGDVDGFAAALTDLYGITVRRTDDGGLILDGGRLG